LHKASLPGEGRASLQASHPTREKCRRTTERSICDLMLRHACADRRRRKENGLLHPQGSASAGFAVDVCYKREDALAAVGATPFDGIVLDIMLPARRLECAAPVARTPQRDARASSLRARRSQRAGGWAQCRRTIIWPNPSPWRIVPGARLGAAGLRSNNPVLRVADLALIR